MKLRAEPPMTYRQAFAHRLWWLACAAAEYGQDKAARIGEVAAEIQMEGDDEAASLVDESCQERAVAESQL